MLVKELCRDCWKREGLLEEFRDFEEIWSEPCLAILCPALIKKEIKGEQHVDKNADPPSGCPYYLEHMLNIHCKENMD